MNGPSNASASVRSADTAVIAAAAEPVTRWPSLNAKLRAWLLSFWPARQSVDARERLRGFVGAGCGILLTGLLSRFWAGSEGLGPWLVAPLGASAVLVFAVPASPLAQPWSVIGGNTLSALVGAACAMLIPDPAFAGAAAVLLAIALMFSLRCLHPPGGAAALFAALGATSFQFALFPVLLNSVLLVLVGLLYNGLTGRRYPHVQVAVKSPSATIASRFSTADLDAALAHYNQVMSVSRDDLEQLLHYAEAQAYQRNIGELRCRDIMAREPLSVQFGTPLPEAWSLMHKQHVKALPVTDRARRLVGIVTLSDFIRSAGLDQKSRVGPRLRRLLRPSGLTHSEKPEVVGQIMSRQVRVASEQRAVSELIPLFAKAGHHHLPIIDAEKRLVGMLTESDVVRALHHATQP